jgi:hypothetical protein
MPHGTGGRVSPATKINRTSSTPDAGARTDCSNWRDAHERLFAICDKYRLFTKHDAVLGLFFNNPVR